MALLTGKSEIIKQLIKELGIPETCKSFTLYCEGINVPLRVACEFYPKQEESPTISFDRHGRKVDGD